MNINQVRKNAPQVLAICVLLALAFVMGRSSAGAPAPAASSSADAQVIDDVAMSALIAQLLNNPNDTETLWSLGNAYFSIRNFVSAAPYYEKLVKVTPKDDGAWIAVGAVAFNTGNDARALEAWTKAAKLNPKNAEAYYNLGFWYLTQTPSQQENAMQAWQKVIDLDPTSTFAKDVMTRMASASTPTPSK